MNFRVFPSDKTFNEQEFQHVVMDDSHIQDVIVQGEQKRLDEFVGYAKDITMNGF